MTATDRDLSDLRIEESEWERIKEIQGVLQVNIIKIISFFYWRY
jgi:hypothetical protein